MILVYFKKFTLFATSFQKLHKNKTIRPFLALLMLVIFTVNITPKRYLHDVFADHKDSISNVSKDGKVQISQDGYHCDCHHLVATSPFVEQDDVITSSLHFQYNLFRTYYSCSIPPATALFFELRGPPLLG
ncbi:MAG: hypothetical protein LH615_15010 [Ferruginibacter sp.]|nr:hypothetical protein [Ferruginibacter sp.]